MKQESNELSVILFRGSIFEVSPANSLTIPRNTLKWVIAEHLQHPILIDGDDLVFCSADGSLELLRLNLKRLLKDEYTRMKVRAVGMKIDHRIELAQCIRKKGRELGINLISKDDWDDIFNVMVRPYRNEETAQYKINDC
ncbi:hypothetical protein DCT80_19700 [Salmonella enterica]|nr:hypothetical protein [Salmonella enterica]EIE9844194.1 hypothetical protein [Salmonella enterica]HAK8555408.1 hypothetical protein [Salmonella enterica]